MSMTGNRFRVFKRNVLIYFRFCVNIKGNNLMKDYRNPKCRQLI